MIIGSRQKLSKITIEPEIRIGETAIKQVGNSKTLGVLIDEHLTWDGQLENIQTKVSRGISMLWRMRKVVLKTTLTKVYNTIISYRISTTAALSGITVGLPNRQTTKTAKQSGMCYYR